MDRLGVCAAFIVLVYLFVNVLFEYVAPFAIGLLLALIFEPLVAWLSRRFKIHRGILAFVAVLLVLFAIGSVGTVIVVRIANEARALAETLPNQMEAVTRGFDNLKTNYISIIELVPEELRSAADNIGRTALSSFGAAASTFVRSTSTSVVKIVPGTLVGVILCFISMYFFIKDREKMEEILACKSPLALKKAYRAVKQGLFDALAGYIRAEATLMLVTGVICVTGLAILRYPYALFLAMLVAFFDFLPVFGPGFILWPWALGSVFAGDFHMAIGLMIIYAVITVTRQVLEPKVLGVQIGVHPLLTLMSMFIGLKVFGAMGFLIGPIIVITVKVLYGLEIWDADEA